MGKLRNGEKVHHVVVKVVSLQQAKQVYKEVC